MTEKLEHFFDNDKKTARMVFALFLFGILVFVINNSVLFIVVDRNVYRIPRLIMRFITSFSWFIAARIGTKANPTKRNTYLMPALVAYIIGDIIVMFSTPPSAVFYGIGHIFLTISIMKTTRIRRYQYVVFGASTVLVVAVMIAYFKGLTLIGFVGILYGMLCSWVMCAALSSKYYRVAGVVFFISDIAGLARKAILDNNVIYVITTFIYFLAIFLLCISVFNEEERMSGGSSRSHSEQAICNDSPRQTPLK